MRPVWRSLSTALPAALATALAAPAALAQDAGVPLFVPVQGRLLDGGDRPVNGAVKLKFAIYSVAENPQGGAPVAPIWTATYSPTLADGVYGLELGDVSSGQPPIPAELFDGTAPRWLGVSVNDGTEMRPRLRIASVPHALLAARALKAEDAKLLGGKLPETFHDAAQLTGVAPPSVLGTGSTALTTVGTITQGTWNGTPVADAHVASAAAWNKKLDRVEHGATLSGDGAATPLDVVFGQTAGTVVEGNDPRFTQLDQKFAGYLPKTGGAITGALTLGANLGVSGAASITGNATITGGLSVTGPSTLTGPVTLGGNLTTPGDVSAGLIRGVALSTNRSQAGLDYNVLFNATTRFTVSQTGPAPLSLPSLFDGNLQPSYSNAAPTASNPQTILIENLPAIHTQVGAWIGWSTRYWNATKFKIEIFDVDQGRNQWRTIADYSSTAYAGGGDFVVAVGPAVVNKIRFTVYETNGTDGRLGVSEFFFLHPEIGTPYQGLMPTTETFTSNLTNAADFTTPAGSSAVNLKFTNVLQNSAGEVFELQSDGGLKVKKAGVVRVTASADVIVESGFNYATMELLVNGGVVTQVLTPYTGGYWTQLTGNLSWKVNAGDVLSVRSYPSQIRSLDNGVWSTLNVTWTGTP